MHQHGSSNPPQPDRQPTRLSLPIKLVLYVSIGIIAYFLITEHWAHLAGFLPYSLLFVCIFMHLETSIKSSQYELWWLCKHHH